MPYKDSTPEMAQKRIILKNNAVSRGLSAELTRRIPTATDTMKTLKAVLKPKTASFRRREPAYKHRPGSSCDYLYSRGVMQEQRKRSRRVGSDLSQMNTSLREITTATAIGDSVSRSTLLLKPTENY